MLLVSLMRNLCFCYESLSVQRWQIPKWFWADAAKFSSKFQNVSGHATLIHPAASSSQRVVIWLGRFVFVFVSVHRRYYTFTAVNVIVLVISPTNTHPQQNVRDGDRKLLACSF